MDCRKSTALHRAALKGHQEVVKVLANKISSEDLSKGDRVGQSALYLATKEGHLEIAQVLASKMLPKDLSKLTDRIFRETALHLAAYNGRKQIVQFFRRNAYPEDIPANADLSLGYKFPNMFKIKLMHKATDVNRYVPVGTQIKLCYIRNVQTQYNPQYAVFHSDGNPLEVDISVSFTEYKTLSRDDLRHDYTDFDPDLADDPTTPLDEGDGGYSEIIAQNQREDAFADLVNNQDADSREP